MCVCVCEERNKKKQKKIIDLLILTIISAGCGAFMVFMCNWVYVCVCIFIHLCSAYNTLHLRGVFIVDFIVVVRMIVSV